MCVKCGCTKNTIGQVNTNLTGKPTASPEGLYAGQGGTAKPGQSQVSPKK